MKRMYLYLLVIFGIILGIAFTNLYLAMGFTRNFSNDCNNLSVSDTSECLREKLGGFYKYNISNIGKSMTLNEIKSQGAVCSQFSGWYVDNAMKLGFNAKNFTIRLNESTTHMFAVISKNNTYCIVDQTLKPMCNVVGI